MPSVDPRPDPVPSPYLPMLSRFRQIMAWMALFAIVITLLIMVL